jgi:hypothetical protein
MSDVQAAPSPTSCTNYAYKASLIGSAHQFELTDRGLSWNVGGRQGFWRYADISSVRLSFRPVSMQQRRFRADLRDINGTRISILSTTWQTATLMAAQDHGYRDFIVELHARMAREGSRAILTAGVGYGSYIFALALASMAALAIAILFVRALATREFTGALFLVGFAALFTWQIGGFIRRNRPTPYSFDRLPKTVLP